MYKLLSIIELGRIHRFLFLKPQVDFFKRLQSTVKMTVHIKRKHFGSKPVQKMRQIVEEEPPPNDR